MRTSLSKNNIFKRKDSSIGYKPSDFMRAQIEMMMGTTEDNQTGEKFTDSTVCKMFLLDCCPYGRFDGCKLDVPNICSKTHSPRLKTDYEKHGQHMMYEVEVYLELKDFLEEQDMKIKSRENVRLDTLRRAEREKEHLKAELEEIARRYDDLIAERDQIDRNVEEFNVEKIESLIRKELMAETRCKDSLEKLNLLTDSQRTLKLCDVCGGFISDEEGNRRFLEHNNGKQHLEFFHLRQKLDQYLQYTIERKQIWNQEQSLIRGSSENGYKSKNDDYRDKKRSKRHTESSRFETNSNREKHSSKSIEDEMIQKNKKDNDDKSKIYDKDYINSNTMQMRNDIVDNSKNSQTTLDTYNHEDLNNDTVESNKQFHIKIKSPKDPLKYDGNDPKKENLSKLDKSSSSEIDQKQYDLDQITKYNNKNDQKAKLKAEKAKRKHQRKIIREERRIRRQNRQNVLRC